MYFLKNQPMDQCKCSLHENFRLKLEALRISLDGQKYFVAVKMTILNAGKVNVMNA